MVRRVRSYELDQNARTIKVNGQAVIDLSTSSVANVVKTVGGAASQAVQLAATGDDTNIDLRLVPKGSGKIDINNEYKLPSADGNANQVLQTDGDGTISFATVSTTSISQGNSSVAVADAGTGTVTVTVDGGVLATMSTALALDLNNATTAIRIPNGTTAQRPSGTTGLLRYNSSTDKIEGYTTADGWAELGASSSAAVADSGESVIGIGQNVKNLDTFATTAYDSALYFAVTMDETNSSRVATQKYSLVHNNTDAFVASSHETDSNSGHDHIAITADIDSDTVRIRGTGASDINSVSWYRWPLGDNTTDTTSGNISIFSQADATNGQTNSNSYLDTGFSTSINNSATKNLDTFSKTAINSAMYFAIHRDETNSDAKMAKYNVTHNGTTAFMNETHVVESDENNTFATVTADISGSTVRLRGRGSSALNSMSYYRLTLGGSTALATSDAVTTFYNSDCDTAAEVLDSWSSGSNRGAKYYLTGKNSDTSETYVVEAIVVHNGTTPYITTYGGISSAGASDDVFTLTTDISGGNVRLIIEATSANWAVIGHRILLADSMTTTYDGSTADIHRTIASTSVSSSATTIDSWSTSDHTGAFYVVTGHNSSEAASSISEVMLLADGSSAYVSSHGISSKGTSQLTFTGQNDGSGGIALQASSSSGGSTSVSAWRVHLKREDAGAAVIDSWSASSYRGAKYFLSLNDSTNDKLQNIEALVVHDGTTAYITPYGDVQTYTGTALTTLTADISGGNVRLKGLSAQCRITGYKVLLSDSESASDGDNVATIATTSVSSSATQIDTFTSDSATGAFYIVTGYNASEGAASIAEVTVVSGVGVDGSTQDAFVSVGPTMSTKGTDQLTFTATFNGTSTVVNAASTSGGSTSVSAYRVDLLRAAGGAVAVNLTVAADQTITSTKTIADDVKLRFGTGGDLQIYHDGSNSYIDDAGTGNIIYRSGTQTFQNAAGSKTMAVFNAASSVDLNYNSTTRLQTSSTGVTVAGVVAMGVVSDPSTVANYAHVYAKDDSASAEVYVRDEAGNVTKLSPHNQKGNWEYFSRNVNTGKVVRVDMEEMIKDIEKLTGKKYIKEE